MLLALMLAILGLHLLGGVLVSQHLLVDARHGPPEKRLALVLIWLLPLFGGLLVWLLLHRLPGGRNDGEFLPPG